MSAIKHLKKLVIVIAYSRLASCSSLLRFALPSFVYSIIRSQNSTHGIEAQSSMAKARIPCNRVFSRSQRLLNLVPAFPKPGQHLRA